jgi:hypothetical protein
MRRWREMSLGSDRQFGDAVGAGSVLHFGRQRHVRHRSITLNEMGTDAGLAKGRGQLSHPGKCTAPGFSVDVFSEIVCNLRLCTSVLC